MENEEDNTNFCSYNNNESKEAMFNHFTNWFYHFYVECSNWTD